MSSFNDALSLLVHHGYIFMFLIMLFEGPTITAVSSFAAALGYFNIWYVALIAVLGNLIPDLLFYAIGYWGRHTMVEKYKKHLGLDKEKIKKLELLSSEHAVKGLLMVKLIPFLSIPGLITAGITRIPFNKYLRYILIIIACNSAFFLIAGYYFGASYKHFSQHIDAKEYLIGFLIILFILVFYGYKTVLKKVLDKVENP